MVSIKSLTGLLLVLAAAGPVLSTPVAGEHGPIARAKKDDDPLGGLLSGGDVSSIDSGSSPSQSPSATPSKSPIVSATPTVVVTPTPSESTSNSPSQTPSATPSSPSTEAVSQTTEQAQTTSAPVVQTTTVPPQSSVLVIVTSVVTSSNGQVFTAAYTTAVPTETASASQNQKTPDTTDNNKTGKIVGGVVGGVGGLLALVALGAVIYRIWGKNRNRSDEDDGLMDDNVYGTSEVKANSGPSTGASPFQNNLEQYHTPGRANPSANF